MLLYTIDASLSDMKAPYFKIQYFNEISLSWVDVQKTFISTDVAKKAADQSKKWRLMMVDGKKRTVIDPASLSE